MTVEEIRGDHENYDWNPVGLRVLAVDDDPICLKLLETQLRKCQYNVTTSSQARIALNMLRENKGRFDLVISDVHMPDMDGFKLLELVGLEMDLPVIMLSANGDPKLVMKGVTHGACDYLVKPVRIEELRNIWQHVIRKKKSNPNRQNTSNEQGRSHQRNGDGDALLERNNADQNVKANRKRKDEEDESDGDGSDSDDQDAQQKKPRVVWSIELHRKFVGAVNQLGIEKAVPKRILDLMNVEGLTRENVASHLQKYRIYLKKANNQSANMATVLGFKDIPFMRIGSLDGYNDFRSLTNPGRLSNISLSPPYSSNNGMLNRLNSSSTNINLRNHSPSSLIPPSQNLNINSLTGLGKVGPISNQSPSLFPGIPTSVGLDQLQPSKGGPNSDDSRIFAAAGNLFGNDPGAAAIGSSSNLLSGVHNNSVILNGNIVFGNQFSETFNSIQPIASDPFSAQLPMNSVRENSSSSSHFLPNNSMELSSNNNMGSVNLEELRWGENRQSFGHSGANSTFGSFNSNLPANVFSPMNRLDQNTGIFNNHKMQMGVTGRSGGGASIMQQQNSDRLATEPRARSNENFIMDQQDLHGGFAPQSFDSLDVLMNSIKREQDGNNCDFGFDDYSFGGV